VSSNASVALEDALFCLPDEKTFLLTAATFVQYGRLLPEVSKSVSFDRLKAASKDAGAADHRQHGAVCAFLDCLKLAAHQPPGGAETYSFVEKCAEYDRYLDGKVKEYRANPRHEWLAKCVTSDSNAILAQVVSEIVGHMGAFSDPARLYESFRIYTDARLKAAIPREVLAMRQEANIAIVLPFFEKAFGVEGDVAEFGCFRGVLAVKLAWLLKANGLNKTYHAFDTFHGFEIADPGGGALGIGAFRDDAFDAYQFLTQWSRILPLTPIRGDATVTCTRLTKALSFVWMDLDMAVLMDPVLRQIWHLCSDDTIIGVDDVGRPETPTVAPWIDHLVASGAAEPVFDSDEMAPDIFIRFLKKKGAYPVEPFR
jgi:hypothetical protein